MAKRAAEPTASGEIHLGDNLALLRAMPDGCCNLIYIDPPFNTQKTQRRDRIAVTKSESGTRAGFGDARYETKKIASPTYADSFEDFCGFMRPRLIEAYRLLAPDGSFFLHIDYREGNYIKG